MSCSSRSVCQLLAVAAPRRGRTAIGHGQVARNQGARLAAGPDWVARSCRGEDKKRVIRVPTATHADMKPVEAACGHDGRPRDRSRSARCRPERRGDPVRTAAGRIRRNGAAPEYSPPSSFCPKNDVAPGVTTRADKPARFATRPPCPTAAPWPIAVGRSS
jgi:hypothetical protein